ncbi:MAG: glycosyltransferase [Planctomycetota bacterium]
MPDQPPKSNQPGQPAITALDVPTPEPLEPRRVLFFGKRKSRTRCTGALVEALRAQGLQVRTVNCSMLKRWIGTWGMRAAVRLVRRLYDPDLCFVFFHDLPPDLMEEISGEIPTVVWMEEQLRHTDSSHVDYVRKVRLLCLSTPDLVEAYRRAGVRDTTFSMSGFSPRYHRPLRAPRAQVRDLCFIGGPGHMGDRPQFLAWLSRMHDVEVFGRRDSWLPYLKRFPELRLVGEVRPRRYARVCAETRIVLGQNQTHDSPLYFSNRLFLTLASGGFHLTHYVPGMEELFDRGVHLDWFESREEALEKIRYYLARPELRARIARQGCELVHEEHRYEDRIREVLAILRLERAPYCPVDSLREEPAFVLEPLPPVLEGRPALRKVSGSLGD